MKTPTIRDLVAINLRYDAGSAALSIRAIAQLLAKILYAEGPKVSKTPKELQKAASSALNIGGIAMAQINGGLQTLKNIHLARESSGRWLLTEKGFAAIEEDVNRARRDRESVLSRHFPGRIERAKLDAWFLDASVDFYMTYGSQWASTFARQAARKSVSSDALASILDSVNRRHGLGHEAPVLEAGFRSFLNSDEPDDLQLNWSLGQALFASQLVAANIGPDPITAKEFNNSIFIADTNVLMVAALEGHGLAPHLNGLGKALKAIGAKVVRTVATRDEYLRAMESRRGMVLRAVENYSLPVLQDSADNFLRTGLQRGCVSREDFEQFFIELMTVPEEISDQMPITVLDSPEVVRWVGEGVADTALQKRVSDAWAIQRRRPKSKLAVQHDAVLTHVAEGLRSEGENCVILTLDRTMSQVADERAGKGENPSWLLFDGLIQILAIDGAGPGLDPSDIAPLMASIIRHRLEPAMHTYTSEDLAYMLDIEERCADLPPERVRDIAAMVAKARYAGIEKSDGELQLNIHRAFQTGKMKIARDLQTTEALVRSQDTQIGKQRKKIQATSGAFVRLRSQELRGVAHRNMLQKAAPFLLTGVVAAIAGVWIARQLRGAMSLGEYVSLLVLCLTPAGAAFGWILKQIIPQWRKDLASVSTAAESEAGGLGEDSSS